MQELKNKIFTIRNKQVMLDRDLARLYGIQTMVLNQAVKRNKERFPKNFMFQLSEIETKILVSQNVIPSKKHLGGYLPNAFTEQGVAMLSSVLRSKTAIEVSIKIIEAFVEMRRYISKNLELISRLDKVEIKQLEHDQKFEQIFNALEDKTLPNKGIFFDGQVFDAYTFVSDLIRAANNSIILIDNYIDDSVLTLFSKTKVKVTIYTNITKQLELDFKKYKEQYNNLEIKQFQKSHDRFLIIDNQVYHFGASLKDLGKKWFAFSKLEKDSIKILDKVSLAGD